MNTFCRIRASGNHAPLLPAATLVGGIIGAILASWCSPFYTATSSLGNIENGRECTLSVVLSPLEFGIHAPLLPAVTLVGGHNWG